MTPKELVTIYTHSHRQQHPFHNMVCNINITHKSIISLSLIIFWKPWAHQIKSQGNDTDCSINTPNVEQEPIWWVLVCCIKPNKVRRAVEVNQRRIHFLCPVWETWSYVQNQRKTEWLFALTRWRWEERVQEKCLLLSSVILVAWRGHVLVIIINTLELDF